MTGRFWTAERDATLRRLWARPELSTRLIGEIMGPGKNAVVGRAHRLGLPGRASPIIRDASAPLKVVVPRAPQIENARRAAMSPRAVPATPAARAMPLARATAALHRTCQWIEGEPAGASSRFCAAPVQRGSSYCAGHHARCWHPFRPKARAA